MDYTWIIMKVSSDVYAIFFDLGTKLFGVASISQGLMLIHVFLEGSVKLFIKPMKSPARTSRRLAKSLKTWETVKNSG